MALKKQMHQRRTENIFTTRGFLKARIGVHHALHPARWVVGCLMLLLSSYALAVTFHPRMDKAYTHLHTLKRVPRWESQGSMATLDANCYAIRFEWAVIN